MDSVKQTLVLKAIRKHLIRHQYTVKLCLPLSDLSLIKYTADVGIKDSIQLTQI